MDINGRLGLIIKWRFGLTLQIKYFIKLEMSFSRNRAIISKTWSLNKLSWILNLQIMTNKFAKCRWEKIIMKKPWIFVQITWKKTLKTKFLSLIKEFRHFNFKTWNWPKKILRYYQKNWKMIRSFKTTRPWF